MKSWASGHPDTPWWKFIGGITRDRTRDPVYLQGLVHHYNGTGSVETIFDDKQSGDQGNIIEVRVRVGWHGYPLTPTLFVF